MSIKLSKEGMITGYRICNTEKEFGLANTHDGRIVCLKDDGRKHDLKALDTVEDGNRLPEPVGSIFLILTGITSSL